MLNTERLCMGCMNDNGAEKVCSICGYDAGQQNDAEALPVRTWLKDRFLVGRILEHNGEGITYIGWDNAQDSIVNIREYFPTDIAQRLGDHSVSMVPGNEFTYNEGIMTFLELQRNLKRLTDLPCLLPVIDVFEDNGTAYSITKAVSGITLREFLVRNGGSLNWEQARPLILPLITTVAGLHEVGIIHRGISPETVFVGRDGKLRLGGICIRPVRMSKSGMVAQLFPGFSAVEQYGFETNVRDGRYTDVYGIAATMFRMLMGSTPMDASERLLNDSMQIPAKYVEILPKHVLSALANGLQLMPENRTANMESFRLSLMPVSGENTSSAGDVKPAVKSAEKPTAKTAPKPATKPVEKDKKSPQKENSSAKKYVMISSLVTALICVVVGVCIWLFLNGGSLISSNTSENSSTESTVSAPQLESIAPVDTSGSQKLYQVPNLVGVPFADVADNIEYNLIFQFKIVGKEFSDKYPRGYIIKQEQTSDQTVKKGTTIELTVSLGSQKVAVPNVIGMDKASAQLELLKRGFLYDNITFIDVYDETQPPNVIIYAEPGVGTTVETDIRITMRYNTYDGTTPTLPDATDYDTTLD